MNRTFLTTLLAAVVATSVVHAEDNAIDLAMKFAHKAPKGEKKLNEKIIEGTAEEADIKKSIDLYKAMIDTKPEKGDQAAFKVKVQKLIDATQEVVDKKPDAIAHYKEAVNCKACHNDFKGD